MPPCVPCACAKSIELDRIDVAVHSDAETLLLINEALHKLAERDAKAAELVKLRFFAGLSYPEAAEAFGISERSAKRCWTYARAWLYRELSKAAGS